MFSALATNTRQVAQQSSSFSTLKILEVVVSVGLLLIGMLSGVLPELQVYNTIGLVL